jgi:nucleoside-diphosphate-sugar epimerase
MFILQVFLFLGYFAIRSESLMASTTSIVTGANGFVGRALVHELLHRHQQQHCNEPDNGATSDEIICLVRHQRVVAEEQYWKTIQQNIPDGGGCKIRVLPYDMVDGGATLQQALIDQSLTTTTSDSKRLQRRVYHVASFFGPTENHQQTALDNVQGTEDLIQILAKVGNCKLILTSSMAAVRGPGQEPSNGQFYTHNDWNTESQLGASWGASYQWSKAEAERRAWRMSKELDVPMVSICPSFVFGPPMPGADCFSYSLKLVNEWIRGESPVQSRLFVDVRDVAKAHVNAGETKVGQRYIVSTESRTPSHELADLLQDVCRQTKLAQPDRIYYDKEFNGGAIAIGQKEVEADVRLRKDLGVKLRPVKDTIHEMAKFLLQKEENTAKQIAMSSTD